MTPGQGCRTQRSLSEEPWFSGACREEKRHMDWNQEALMALRVLVAVVLGGLLGWEREWRGREAGIRTFGAVSLGSCMFALISTHVTGGNNPHVIAAGVVTGIGFLGAGTILREQGSIVGLTTAATLWAAAAVGMAVGYGMYTAAALVTAILFGLLRMDRLPGWRKRLKAAERSPVVELERGSSALRQGATAADVLRVSTPPGAAERPHSSDSKE